MKYTALTIGPIIDSLNKAHKTREIWAASFFFSHLMELVIGELLNNGITEAQFIIPYPKAREFDINNKFKKAGIFPDRLILKSEDGLFEKLSEAFKNALDELIAQKINYKNSPPKENISNYLNQYLRANIIETELPNNANVIEEVSRLLVNTELQNHLIPEDELYFDKFLRNIQETDLSKDVFGGGRSYPSIIEISTRSLGLLSDYFNNSDDEEDLWKKISDDENYKSKLKTAHKYIAIVQADGDNVGKLITQIFESNPGLITEFSKAISTFSIDAINVVNNYGGEAIYSGGDDLLFFAPVISNSKNIFDLLAQIDKTFETILLENPLLKLPLEQLIRIKDENGKKLELPSMSYGLTVTYYKYPMHEALNTARKLLFEKAKTCSKNAIAYTLQKHSGQSFEDIISKRSNFYNEFGKMLENEDDNLINSLLYNLENQKFILGEIAGDKERLTNFFDNFYDEDIHKKNKGFIDKLKEMLYITYEETDKDIEITLKKVYSALRFIKFINRKNDE